MTPRPVAALLPLLFVLSSCATSNPDRPGDASPPPASFASCGELTAAPSSRGARPIGDPTEAPRLPELSLPCFADGLRVQLRDVRGPAVVNIWASWCAPCRRELPAFQRLAQRSQGRLHVIGVNSRDSRDAAAWIGADYGLTFPSLVDDEEQLLRELGRNALPLTILVDGQGRIRHVDASGALTEAALTVLVERHLGVVLA